MGPLAQQRQLAHDALPGGDVRHEQGTIHKLCHAGEQRVAEEDDDLLNLESRSVSDSGSLVSDSKSLVSDLLLRKHVVTYLNASGGMSCIMFHSLIF